MTPNLGFEIHHECKKAWDHNITQKSNLWQLIACISCYDNPPNSFFQDTIVLTKTKQIFLVMYYQFAFFCVHCWPQESNSTILHFWSILSKPNWKSFHLCCVGKYCKKWLTNFLYLQWFLVFFSANRETSCFANNLPTTHKTFAIWLLWELTSLHRHPLHHLQNLWHYLLKNDHIIPYIKSNVRKFLLFVGILNSLLSFLSNDWYLQTWMKDFNLGICGFSTFVNVQNSSKSPFTLFSPLELYSHTVHSPKV